MRLGGEKKGGKEEEVKEGVYGRERRGEKNV